MIIFLIHKRFQIIKKLLEILGEESSCYGEFLRIYFEYEYHKYFNDTNMLSFYYINKKQGFFNEDLISNFNGLITKFEINKYIVDYKIINIICSSDSRLFGYEEKIPFYRLLLQRTNNNFAYKRDPLQNKADFLCVNILCWKPKFLGEVSVNCIEYKNNKFISEDNKFNLNEIKENIKNKKMYFSKDLELIQNLAFPEKSIPRNRKIKFLSLIYNNIEKKLKYLPNGYHLLGNLPCIKTEYVEECSITSQEAPYLNLTLECSHKISLEAYKGIIFSKFENSESIRCPYCRDNLKIKFYKSN